MSRTITVVLVLVAFCAVSLLASPSPAVAAVKKPAEKQAVPQDPAKQPGDEKAGAKDPAKKPDDEKAAKSDEPKEPAKKPPKAEPPPLSEDQKKMAAVRADMATNVDKALEDAKNYLRDGTDEDAKTDALAIVADALRKKSDWRGALTAYQKVRDRYEKGSDSYLKYDAIMGVVRASPTGVYQAGAAAKAAGGAETKTLADEAALDAALEKYVQGKVDRLKPRMTSLKRAKTPQELVTLFTPMADEYRQAGIIAPKVAGETAHEATVTAGTRLQEIGSQLTDSLRAQQQKYQPKWERPWSFTNFEKKEMENGRNLCKLLAVGEKNFQQLVTKIGGDSDWPEGQRLTRDSEGRKTAYERLVEGFTPIPYTVDIITH